MVTDTQTRKATAMRQKQPDLQFNVLKITAGQLIVLLKKAEIAYDNGHPDEATETLLDAHQKALELRVNLRRLVHDVRNLPQPPNPKAP